MASLAIALFGSNMRGMLRQRHGSSVKDEDDESDDVERPLRPRRSLSAGKQRIPGSSGSQQSQQTMLMRLAASHHQQHPSFRYVLRLSLVVSFVCCCLFPLVILVAMTVFAPVKVYLIGNGYTASGGVIGDLVDRHLVAKYRAKLHRMDSNNKLNFPDVTIKATRKTEHSHHSRYLQEILRLHYNTNATVNATTTMAVAVTYETAVQHNHRWQKHHYRSSSSSRRVKIDGANALLATNLFHSVQALRAEDCTSNWLCQRCLSTAFFGAYATCAAFCRHCYIRIISTISKVVSEDAKLVVSLTTASSGGFFSSSSKNDEQQPNLEVNRRRIPKIVHQSWLRYPRTLEYPELARLQTTWRTIGTYEYHFYTEKQQKLFIQEHYPVIVTTAYEKIPDSAHRRDFFKLLVLFKEGGVFANGTYEVLLHSFLLFSCI